MPFRTGYAVWQFGYDWWNPADLPYCQVDPNASDYGVCYNIIGKAIFFSSRTVPCESQGTCVRIPAYTSFMVPLYQYYPYAVDFSSSGKQGILKMLYINEFTNNQKRNALSLVLNAPFLSVLIDGMSIERNPPISMYPLIANNNKSGNNPQVNGYDPQMNWYGYINLFGNPPLGKQIIVKYETQTLFQSIVPVYWAYGTPSWPAENLYSAGVIILFYSYEASPELIMPLDYREYLKYPDLRRAVGYQSSGRHPGWNASDIISLAKDIFPDRVWMVFDDSDLTLYGYGITLEQIPEWLIDMLNPVEFKVLKEPWDSQVVEKFISELERRNYVSSQE